MVEVTYVPSSGSGAWRAAVSAQPAASAGVKAIAVLAPDVTPQTAEAVWRKLGDGGIGALVEALTGAFGTSLTAIPPFALVVAEDDGVRVAVRGPLEVVVEAEDGAVSVSGRGVATWAERVVARVHRVSVSTIDDVDATQTLPIESGVVAIDAIMLSMRASAAPSLAEPAPAAPAEPAPAEPAPAAAAEEQAPAAETLTSTGEPEAAASDTLIPSATHTPIDGVPVLDATVVRPDVPREPSVLPPTELLPVPGEAGVGGVARSGDHDGATISVAEARAMRAAAAHSFEPVADVPARAPSRGRVRLSTGQVVELERPVVVGRRPRSTRASGAELPTLVAVESPQGDISRSHVEIRAEGEHVLVTDLATTNGTVLVRVGKDPVRLHPNEPTMVVTGDTLDLGDGVTVTFEDLP